MEKFQRFKHYLPLSFMFLTVLIWGAVYHPILTWADSSDTNNPPVAEDMTLYTLEDVSIDGLLQATDAESDTLRYSVVSEPEHGTVVLTADMTGTVLITGTGGMTGTGNVTGTMIVTDGVPNDFVYYPHDDFNGTDSFTFLAHDGEFNSNEAVVTIVIAPVNDAPRFKKGADEVVHENAGAQTVENWATKISQGPSNEANQTLTFIVASDNADLFSDEPTIDTDGTLTYTPADEAYGMAIVSVQLKDDGGTVNGGEDTSSTKTFFIVVEQDIPAIKLKKTVGTNPNQCANSNAIYVESGSEVTYCYTVKNVGDVPLTKHTLVDDKLGTLLTDEVHYLAPGDSWQYLTTAIVREETTNEATWTATDGIEHTASDTDFAHVKISKADLKISKSLNIPAIFADNDIEYTIYYKNKKNHTARNVRITDTLPSNVTYVDNTHSNNGSHDISTEQTGDVVVWTIPLLEGGERGYIYLTVHIDANAQVGDKIENTVVIHSDTADSNTNNNSDSHASYVTVPFRDLAIRKKASGYVEAGKNFWYRLYYRNDGNIEATHVSITDTLPVEVSYVSQSNHANAVPRINGNTITWQLPVLGPFQSGRIDLQVMVDSDVPTDTELINEAIIGGADDDIDFNNNETSISTVVQPPAGSITGTVTFPDGNPMHKARVKVYANNNGSKGHWVAQTRTDRNGDYEVELPPGSYFLKFRSHGHVHYPKEYYDDAYDVENATPVRVMSGKATPNINVAFNEPAPPLAEGSMDTGHIDYDPITGEIEVWMPAPNLSDLTIKKVITCTGSGTGVMPTDVILLLVTEDGDVEPVNGTVMLSGTLVIGVGYPMISIGNNTYAATIPAEEIVEGTLRVMYKCGGLLYDELIGSITLFDPSGFITDAVTQQPVIGASVELFKLDDWTVKSDASDAMPETCHTIITKGTTPWNDLQSAPEQGRSADTDADPQEMDPTVNPLITDSNGYYAWDVAGGCWYVVVEADGYETRISPAVGVPPEVTDLDLTLMPLERVNTVYLPIIMKQTTQPTPTSVVPTETPNPMATSTLAPGDVPRPTTSSLAP